MGIFSFYDKEGVVGRYIDILLDNLIPNLDLLVVVVNGVINKEGIEIFRKYTNKILIRENTGYDAGAYKDAIINYIGVKEVGLYDQVILCNDTFYGPFRPFKEIFKEMDQRNIDFWGFNYVKNNVANHIQSYFMVINASIIKKGDLFEFFVQWIDDKVTEIDEVYAFFEIGIFEYFISKGYSFSAYAQYNHFDIYKSSNYCIKKYNFPIMKKKCFAPLYYKEGNVIDALKHIGRYLDYDIELIISNAKRIYGFPWEKKDIVDYPDSLTIEYKYPISKIGRSEIRAFLSENDKVYIYGAGVIARKLFRLYSPFFQHVKGFVISDNKDIMKQEIYGYPILHVSEIQQVETAVLVALDVEHSQEVKPILNNNKNVLFLW